MTLEEGIFKGDGRVGGDTGLDMNKTNCIDMKLSKDE